MFAIVSYLQKINLFIFQIPTKITFRTPKLQTPIILYYLIWPNITYNYIKLDYIILDNIQLYCSGQKFL